MFIHHVYFWLKNKDRKEDYDRLLEGLQSLRQIEPKVLLHIGTPAETSREVIDGSYTFSELFLFETAADQAAYQVHPVHQQFVKDCAHLWERVVVYDSVNV
jgi:hypothetical protein